VANFLAPLRGAAEQRPRRPLATLFRRYATVAQKKGKCPNSIPVVRKERVLRGDLGVVMLSTSFLILVALKLGVQTPGVQIPISKLKPEVELNVSGSPKSILTEQSVWISNQANNTLERIDPKENKVVEPVSDFKQPCGNPQLGFGSVWLLNCGDGTLVRVDTKTAKITKAIKTGADNVRAGLAASPDSIWAFTDDKTTLSRIDPAGNKIVGEMRLPAGCNSMAFGETSLWVTCPTENRVLRIDPNINVVSQRIEVSTEPYSIAVGEGSVWVYCKKDGRVDRIDPKTNKVSKTIELAVPNAEGDIAAGEGSVWITMPGFPISRIDPKTDKVVQQFVGEGGGFIKVDKGTVWLTNVKQNSVWRLDLKRVLATLAE
jgi:virginiamycin B lyase